jgi:LacI family transcriptional regulator
VGAVSINDVASAAGVHRSTVSRAFSRPDAVNLETREHILSVARSLGYRMNPLAQALRTKASTLVPFLVPDITNPFFAELARAASSAAGAHGYQLVLGVMEDGIDGARGHLELMQALYAPFSIIAPTTRSELEFVIEQSTGNVVVIDRVPADVDLASVSVDNAHGIELAITHLRELGHRSIAYVAGPLETLTAQDRLAAYRKLVTLADIEPHILEGGFPVEAGQRAAKQFLDLRDRPTAVIASNDMAAFGFMAAVTESGIRVPQDLSVVGFDGLAISATFNPALTTVAQPIDEMGKVAIEIAIASFVDDKPPGHRVLQPRLVERRSTCPPASH